MSRSYLVKEKNISISLIILLILMMLIVGCDKKTDTSINSNDTSGNGIKVTTENENFSDKAETAQDNKVHDNKTKVLANEEIPNSNGTRIVKDMVGREVEIPNKVNKVFTTSPVGTIALYTINPDKIAGLNNKPGELEEKYLLKEYLELPILGTYKDANSGNEEEILKVNPDIIISMGNLDESWIESADESQEKLNIPFLMIDGDIANLDKSYEFLGEVLGEQERCKELAEYCRKTIEDTKKIASKIPKDKRKKVYYGTDGAGLSSAVRGSLHTQPIEMIGAINVVGEEWEEKAPGVIIRSGNEPPSTSGRVQISMEQVLKWDPEIIIATQGSTNTGQAYDAIVQNSKWGSSWNNIDAVKNNKVYGIPYAPFNWFDRPPSVNRILGVRWLGNIVYPEYFKINLRKETKEFYKTFYHRELTNSEIDEILKNSMIKK